MYQDNYHRHVFKLALNHTNTVTVIWQLSNFTRVEPLTFRKLAGYLPHMKESSVPGGIQTHSSEGLVDRHVILVNVLLG